MSLLSPEPICEFKPEQRLSWWEEVVIKEKLAFAACLRDSAVIKCGVIIFH